VRVRANERLGKTGKERKGREGKERGNEQAGEFARVSHSALGEVLAVDVGA
jgi:hypothetical protein